MILYHLNTTSYTQILVTRDDRVYYFFIGSEKMNVLPFPVPSDSAHILPSCLRGERVELGLSGKPEDRSPDGIGAGRVPAGERGHVGQRR